MKLLKTTILAFPLTVTANVGLAADYEIFAEFTTVATWGKPLFCRTPRPQEQEAPSLHRSPRRQD
jgi:hypothetical protein